ncbi:MAG TPA: hopanoid biosynthesis-associated protein HpnK, partial [Methyloceanibacter sp.]
MAPTHTQRAKTLIVTADDFGLSKEVNEAVERGHRDGILSAASLMVGAPAKDDAVRVARANPKLGVGLHVTLLDGRPVLPASEIPGLVGPNGRFSTDPVRFGIALNFSPELRAQARAEIEAQFRRFRETGLVLDHINGHKHFHLHPAILETILRLAPSFGSPPIRVPFEPFAPSFEATRDRALGRLTSACFYFLQTRRLARKLEHAGIAKNDYVFGLNDSGALTEQRMLNFIERLPPGVTELYCHPATRSWAGDDTLPGDYRPVQEFHALISPAVKARL